MYEKRRNAEGKKVKTVEIKRLKEYEQMELDSKAALIEELIPLRLMH